MDARFRSYGGEVEIRLSPDVAAVLGYLPGILDAVGPPEEDPGAGPLARPFSRDDPGVDAELRRLVGDDLDESRHSDRAVFLSILDAGSRRRRVSKADAEAFLRVLVEARLVLAARAGIEEEDDYLVVEEGTGAILDLLGYLQVGLVEALAP